MINTQNKVHATKETPEKLYNIVEDVEVGNDVILETDLTLSDAEERLCWHLNHDADAYIQDVL